MSDAARCRAAGRSCPEPDGFTLVEAVLTVGIIVVVMTAMLVVFLRSSASISLSRQRQAGSSLASEAMEQLRALPYAQLAAGLVPSDLSGDPNVVSSAGGYRLRLPGSGIDEPLVTAGTSSSAAPLYPHVSTRVVDGATYSISTYVTQVSASSPYLLTVLTRWTAAVSGGTGSSMLRSAAFSPSGCLSQQTHPFSGPCQTSYSGQASVTGGTIAVLSDAGAGEPIIGFSGSSLSLAPAGASTALALEQTGTATSRSGTTGASAGASATSGQQSELAAASTDPTSGDPPASTATAPGQTWSSVQLAGTAGTLTATPSSTDTASGYAYASSAATCIDPMGGPLAAGVACAGADARLTGTDATIRADLSGSTVVRSLTTFDLARISAAPSPARTVVSQVLSATTAGCPGTTGDGCTYAAASRNLGTIVLGGLPAGQPGDTIPAGFVGMVRITGLAETARAEAGNSERTPTSTRSGTLSYWNGTGYTAIDLSAATPPPLTPATVTATYPGVGGSVVVTATPSLTIGSTATTSTGTMPCTSQQCTRVVQGGAITVTVVYGVSVAGSALTRFALNADLGSLLTSATFTGAPSG